MDNLTWTPITVRLSALDFWEHNPKRLTKAQAKRLADSTDRLGRAGVLLVGPQDARGRYPLYDGHQRANIWRTLYGPDAEVHALQSNRELSEDERLSVSVLTVTAVGSLDFDALAGWDAGVLQDLGLGVDYKRELDDAAANIAAMLEAIAADAAPVADVAPQLDRAEELQELWQVQPGDVWQMGEHRLICGDCTDRAVVERVMGGEKARTIFTDPPYGIGKEIINDNLRREDWLKFYELFTANMLDFAITNAYVFVWGYFEGLSDYWQEIVKTRGDCNFRNFIIWKKSYIQGRNVKDFRQFPENYAAALLYIFGQPFQNGPWSTSPNAEYYPEIFEPIRAYLDGERQKMGWDIPTVKKIVNHSDLARDHWFGRSQWSMPTREVYQKLQLAARNNAFRKEYDELRKEYDELRGYFDNSHNFTDLWEFEKLTTDNRHPTVKPVEVCERGIISTSQKGEIVLDVFLGSGSTLIACERLGRRCRAVEIEPKYVAVTLQRWADATGGTPVRLENAKWTKG